MLDNRIARHCTELDRCNQRGGRMFSIFDLLEAGTLDLDLAAFLMARITRGASFMVGAHPGGAGKTTVMCALLNLIPHDCEIVAATLAAVHGASRKETANRCCYACHEVGSGPYFAYLWNGDLRTYCALSAKGHILAANLHADDLDEARDQVCGENRVPASHFNAFHLLVFLRAQGGFLGRRWIDRVYVSDGAAPHALYFEKGSGAASPPEVSENERASILRCRGFLENGLRAGLRTIEDTRREVLAFQSASSAARAQGFRARVENRANAVHDHLWCEWPYR